MAMTDGRGAVIRAFRCRRAARLRQKIPLLRQSRSFLLLSSWPSETRAGIHLSQHCRGDIDPDSRASRPAGMTIDRNGNKEDLASIVAVVELADVVLRVELDAELADQVDLGFKEV